MMRILITLLFLCTTLYTQAAKTEYGLASVYSDEYENSATASGESYDPSKHTAAHKSLPFGSIVKVTNMESGKSMMVKINDRGPFIKGYVIEISSAVGDILKVKDRAKVKIEVKKEGEYPEDSELKEDSYFEDNENLADAPETYEDSSNPFSETETKPEEEAIATVETKATTDLGESDLIAKGGITETTIEEAKAVETEKKPKTDELSTLKTSGYKIYDLYKASTFIPKSAGYGVQVGTYNHLHNVLKETAKLQENWFSNILLTREDKGGKLTYKVIIGPFENRAAAESYKKNAAKKGAKGFVVAVQPTKTKEVYQVKAVRPAKKGFAVQIMNMTDADNVILEIEKLKNKWFKNILINVVEGKDGEPHYKIFLGPFPERGIANSYKENLAKKGMKGFVVDLSTIK